jgi:hypothetical protein
MRHKKAEVHIILDLEGVNCVQIVGPTEVHPEGHNLYMLIRDLVQEFDKSVRDRLEDKQKTNV